MQAAFDTQPLADRLIDAIVTAEIPEPHRAFIESRDFFFLSTVDHRGFPTCSHKGGPSGFVRVLDATTLAFPSYDGNGMYLSMGNLSANPHVGLLFLDYQTPHRVRLHGLASIDRDDPLLADYPGAQMVARVNVVETFINCPRYIHPAQRQTTSKYVPAADGSAPLPAWKRIDAMQDVITPAERAAVAAGEGTLTFDDYAERVQRGEG